MIKEKYVIYAGHYNCENPKQIVDSLSGTRDILSVVGLADNFGVIWETRGRTVLIRDIGIAVERMREELERREDRFSMNKMDGRISFSNGTIYHCGKRIVAAEIDCLLFERLRQGLRGKNAS